MPEITSSERAGAAVEIRINGERRTVPAALSLDTLVGFLGLDSNRLAIEYNREIVKRSRWQSVTVQEGDSLELVQFVGGG